MYMYKNMMRKKLDDKHNIDGNKLILWLDKAQNPRRLRKKKKSQTQGRRERNKNEMSEFSNFQIRSSIDFNLISLFLSLVQA